MAAIGAHRIVVSRTGRLDFLIASSAPFVTSPGWGVVTSARRRAAGPEESRHGPRRLALSRRDGRPVGAAVASARCSGPARAAARRPGAGRGADLRDVGSVGPSSARATSCSASARRRSRRRSPARSSSRCFAGLFVEANGGRAGPRGRIAGGRRLGGRLDHLGPRRQPLPLGRARRRRRGGGVFRSATPRRSRSRPDRRCLGAEDGLRRLEQDRRGTGGASPCDRPCLRCRGRARRRRRRPARSVNSAREGLALGAGDGRGRRHRERARHSRRASAAPAAALFRPLGCPPLPTRPSSSGSSPTSFRRGG